MNEQELIDFLWEELSIVCHSKEECFDDLRTFINNAKNNDNAVYRFIREYENVT